MDRWFPNAITARHARILDHLGGGEVLTAIELSRLVNASHRTVYRDIVTLRQAGHKIIGAAGFGFMLKGKRTMIGPTGKFPHGKLDPTDEGELSLAVAFDFKNNVVRVEFGKPVAWLALDPAAAIELGNLLIVKAMSADQFDGPTGAN